MTDKKHEGTVPKELIDNINSPEAHYAESLRVILYNFWYRTVCKFVAILVHKSM